MACLIPLGSSRTPTCAIAALLLGCHKVLRPVTSDNFTPAICRLAEIMPTDDLTGTLNCTDCLDYMHTKIQTVHDGLTAKRDGDSPTDVPHELIITKPPRARFHESQIPARDRNRSGSKDKLLQIAALRVKTQLEMLFPTSGPSAEA
ncbi:hypothetical protein PGTUg99_018968 [Puccinia graminis f. sp. tritici]|uniref:Uncharacterized protein n=1 Tax=Puccinia graminis f. sp. tritici TaxID=56615 RepID=A0A5B0SBF7_PUCGR|nr:hypothetical protein PGTUg99_018968 [Puccinia graminis f. sp. tritici]